MNSRQKQTKKKKLMGQIKMNKKRRGKERKGRGRIEEYRRQTTPPMRLAERQRSGDLDKIPMGPRDQKYVSEPVTDDRFGGDGRILKLSDRAWYILLRREW